MQRLTIIFLTMFLLQASYTKAQSKKDSVHTRIQGKWVWTATEATAKGGIDNPNYKLPPKITPSTCKCDLTLTITDDKIISHSSANDSLIRLYSNKRVQDSSSYSLREIAFLKDPVRIVIDSKILAGDVDIYGDTSMVVSYWVWDGGGTDYSFKKIK